MSTLRTIFKNKVNLVGFIVLTVIFALFYYFALTRVVDWKTFVEINSPIFVIAQIILSLGNSVLGAYSLILLKEVIVAKKNNNNFTFVQLVGALFFSIITTGCFVCGSIILPSIGIASSLAPLPFAGLEVKILSLLLLLWSIHQLDLVYRGICKIETKKVYRFVLGSFNLNFKLKYLQRIQPLFITLIFVLSIYLLPAVLPSTNNTQKMCDGVPCVCPSLQNSKN